LDYNFDIAILIYQKEFASRMIAKAGINDYSRLSVNVYYRANCDILETIPKNCFKPIPKVDSCIVRLTPRKKPAFYVIDEKFFYEFTRNLFNNRRKKINTIIQRNYNINIDKIPFSNNRAEELTPEQLGELSNIIFNSLNS
jgi:16S rRNA (adenine1518-N6/adenine1519-N6)-dimethyltransferase